MKEHFNNNGNILWRTLIIMSLKNFRSGVHHFFMKQGIGLFVLFFISVQIFFNHCLIAQQSTKKVKFGYYGYNLDAKSYSSISESMKLWVEAIQKRSKYKQLSNSIIEIKFYLSDKDLYADILNQTLDCMNLTSWDYFRLNLSEQVLPLVVSSVNSNSKFEKYLLITSIDSQLDEISKLSNVQIHVPKSNSSNLIKTWLKAELREKLGEKRYKTIRIIDSNQDEKQTLLSIFFKRIDFTVVREGSYFIAGELNPQIKKFTSIIGTSPNLINYFLARQRDLNLEFCKAVVEESHNLPSTIEGKQVLNIIKTEKIFELSHEDFSETEKLFTRYNRLFK